MNDLDLCTVILIAKSNDIGTLRPLGPALRAAVSEAAPGRVIHLRA